MRHCFLYGVALLVPWLGACDRAQVSSLGMKPEAISVMQATPNVPAEPETVTPAGPPDPAPAPREAISRVVLVTIDGVRWQDVFGVGATPYGADPSQSGPAMPGLLRLVQSSGVALGSREECGKVLVDGPSWVSLPGYLEIFTGQRTQCAWNECPRTTQRTFMEEARTAFESDTDVASIASWDHLERAVSSEPDAFFVSSGTRYQSHAVRATDEVFDGLVLEAQGHGGAPGGSPTYRPDDRTADIALAYLAAYRPRLLHIGFGDADEYGHQGDVRAYMTSLHKTDAFLERLEGVMATWRKDGDKATVLVTTDHGRAKNFRDHGFWAPESARSFLVAFGDGAPNAGIACAKRDVHVKEMGSIVHGILGTRLCDGVPCAPIEELISAGP